MITDAEAVEIAVLMSGYSDGWVVTRTRGDRVYVSCVGVGAYRVREADPACMPYSLVFEPVE